MCFSLWIGMGDKFGNFRNRQHHKRKKSGHYLLLRETKGMCGGVFLPKTQRGAKMTNPKKLITLEEHNKIATQINHTGGNGISCPNCGSELFDATNLVILTTTSQYLTFCRECNYKGTRF